MVRNVTQKILTYIKGAEPNAKTTFGSNETTTAPAQLSSIPQGDTPRANANVPASNSPSIFQQAVQKNAAEIKANFSNPNFAQVTDPYGQTSTSTAKKIAVVDDFRKVDGRMTHGEVVTAMLRGTLLNKNNHAKEVYNIQKIQNLDNNSSVLDAVLEHPGQYAAVNLSMGRMLGDYEDFSEMLVEKVTPENLREKIPAIREKLKEKNGDAPLLTKRDYKYFSDVLGKEITPKNFKENLPAIHAKLKEEKEDTTFLYEPAVKKIKYFREMGEKIDKIVEAGVPVYVAAGNGRDMINSFGIFSDKATLVSSDDEWTDQPAGEHEGLARNSRVDIKAPATFHVRKVDGGYDFDGDGQADAPQELFPPKLLEGRHYILGSSSFQTPHVLALELIKKQSNQKEK